MLNHRSRTRWVVVGTVVVALAGCNRRPVPTSPPVAVEVKAIRSEPVLSAMRFSATVREEHRVELSFKVPGTVKSLLQVPGLDGKLRNVHEGDNRLRIVEGERSQVRIGNPIVVAGSFRLAEGLAVRVVNVPDAGPESRK